MSLLDVRELSVDYEVGSGSLRAVDTVSLALDAGEAVGIAGESGCGKTTLGLAIPGLLPVNATASSGTVQLDGQDILGLSDSEANKLRWKRIAFIFQGATNALNPVGATCTSQRPFSMARSREDATCWVCTNVPV